MFCFAHVEILHIPNDGEMRFLMFRDCRKNTLGDVLLYIYLMYTSCYNGQKGAIIREKQT